MKVCQVLLLHNVSGMKEEEVMKYRFIIVGSGWRSLFYVRIAKALSDKFELGAMLCRTKEKAERIARENDIYTTTSIEECREMKPDFVVVAVNKASIAQVSKEWMSYGFTVLCETPAALDVEMLNELWRTHVAGGRLVVAEQYKYDALYQAQLMLLERKLIGEPSFLYISLAHEYHGASLMRAYLEESVSTAFTVSAKRYEFPTVETLSRYEKFTDGRVVKKTRTVATYEFADGKVAVYEFDSEQYHSPIRNNYVKLQGVRGEMKEEAFYWLDERNEPRKAELVSLDRAFNRDSENPNLKSGCECRKISFVHEDGREEVVYETPFEGCDVSAEEVSMAVLMLQAAEYDRELATEELRNALQDAYMAVLMKQAVETGEVVSSQVQIWQIK